MQASKVFISHSHKDQLIARALVELLEQAGVNRNSIIASSVPKAQLPTGSPLYDEIRSALSDKDTFVIFLLSDNFYSSTVCLNEMGAAWIMGLKFQFMILPGFSFEKANGVIMEKNPIGISLARNDDVTLTRLNELYTHEFVPRFKLPVDVSRWALAMKDFFAAVERYQKELTEKVIFSMDNVESFCIGSNDHDGCRIIHRESSPQNTTVKIDFSRSESTLCSIVYTIEQKKSGDFLNSGKNLCFEVYCDSEPVQAEIELHMADRNKSVPLLITDDIQTCRIPLAQFATSKGAWENIKELCFLFREQHIEHPITVFVKNLRLEK